MKTDGHHLHVYRDDDGVFVRHGDKIRFSFGTPGVRVIADVVFRDGDLIALTPDVAPKECKLSSLRRYVGAFWKLEPTT